MKKILTLLFLLIVSNAWGAPPTRQASYTPNTTIRSTDVTSNENAIFSYLQNGVDAYSDGTILNADISSSAGISSSKLDLSSISQNISSSGTLTQSGTATFGTTSTTSASFTAITNAGTVTTGIVTKIKINGGVLDNVAIGFNTASLGNFSSLKLGTANKGDVFYDNGDGRLSRLTPGTNGQFLKTQGTGANPAWGGAGALFVSNTAVAAATNSGDISISATKYYKVIIRSYGISANESLNLRFNNDTGATYDTGSSGQTSMPITGTLKSGGSGTGDDQQADIELYIFPQATSATTLPVFVKANSVYFNTSSHAASASLVGFWANSAALTSFRVISSSTATWTGNVIVYELSQS